MAKEFAPRVSKKKRKTLDLSHKLNRDLYQMLESSPLLKGAQLEMLGINEIVVKEQVRTKFNDDSIKELAANIKVNGLIQPLVVHREGARYVLICGERRYRAMTLIKMKEAPCFVLEGKTREELMSIQFSENSSREQLHYIDKADGILNYQKATKASERKIVDALGISKTEVHRSLIIAKLPSSLKEAAKKHNVEKYVLLEFDALKPGIVKDKIHKAIDEGLLTKRVQIKKAIANSGDVVKGKVKKKARAGKNSPSQVSAAMLLKAMKSRTEDLDPETKKALKDLLDDAQDMVDL